MDEHLDYEKSERSDDDSCNQYKHKQVNNRFKSIEIQVPQDRKSAFEPQAIKKCQKDISNIDQKIISVHSKGMTTRQISETIENIYSFETLEGFISDTMDKIFRRLSTDRTGHWITFTRFSILVQSMIAFVIMVLSTNRQPISFLASIPKGRKKCLPSLFGRINVQNTGSLC